MNRIDELIERLCPDGVEYKKIKNRFIRLKGSPITAVKMKEIAKDNGEIQIFAGGKTMVFADESDIPRANVIRTPAVLMQSRGIIDAVYCERPFTFKNEMWAYTSNNQTETKFLYYVLKNNMRKFRDEASGMGSMPQISLKVTEEFRIPVPPMEIQAEIVKVLDSFAELEAELEARKAQYTYYRDKLFDFSNEEVAWLPLGEIATIDRGGSFQKCHFGNGSIGCLHYGQIYTHYGIYASKTISALAQDYDGNLRWANPGDVIMAVTSENVDDVCKSTAWLGKSPIAISGHTAILRHAQNPKYLSYYFSSKWFQQEKRKYAQGTKVIEVSPKKITKVLIPVPSLEEQERIVSILDKFDALVNDISQGLPAEIEARRKQYEYYRDKLLAFKEKAV